MTSRERVVAVIEHRKPDRVPIYGWVRANLDGPITQAFGSCDAFEDHYEFDLSHLFGGPPTFEGSIVAEAAQAGPIDPMLAATLPTTDPDDMSRYADIVAQIKHHKEQRGRFVYVQTPGIFEALNGIFGIENHLMYLAMYPDEIREVYAKQADWNRRFAMNCIDLGVDMVHVSDDWGSERGLLFNPKTWWSHMHPYHKTVVDAVKARGCYASVHSDGNVNSVIDGLIDLGYNVVHPWQESAGMSLAEHKSRWAGNFTVMGGLDVQTTIGFGKIDFLKSEIERVMRLYADGGLLFCTTHYIQDHCGIEELKIAFDLAYELSRSVAK